jgi:hypothetical protein
MPRHLSFAVVIRARWNSLSGGDCGNADTVTRTRQPLHDRGHRYTNEVTGTRMRPPPPDRALRYPIGFAGVGPDTCFTK